MPRATSAVARNKRKKKVFKACLPGMKTTDEGLAAWDGHVFMTSAGPCKTSIKGGVMR